MEDLFKDLSRLGMEQLLIGLVILFGGLLLVRLVMNIIKRYIGKMHVLNPALYSMLLTAVSFVMKLVVILTAASAAGIPITSFVALLSVVSLAISLAIQGVLGNLAGGIIILASKPFTLDEYIESDSVAGTVKEIGFLHTKLLAPDGKQIFIPNNMLYSSRIINYSAHGTRRIDLTIAASYDNSPDQVRAAVMDAIAQVPQLIDDPAPVVHVEDYGDNAIKYIVRVWTASSDFLDAKYALNEAIYGAFKRNGVEMTYPHLNVHMN